VHLAQKVVLEKLKEVKRREAFLKIRIETYKVKILSKFGI